MFEDYMSKTSKSRKLYEQASKVLPAGVSYGLRYFEPYPFYTAKAKGSKLYDVDGNTYVDFWLGHTTHILGHNHPAINKAVKDQLENGTHYGTCHQLEIALAEKIKEMVPNAEMTRFTNSGTEANMYAIRLARAYSGKSKIAKFEGGWHGGYDALHVGVKYPFDVPESAGLTVGAVEDTTVLPFNDFEGVKEKLNGEEIACIIVEPVMGAGGGIPAEKEFLKALREFCDEKGILLVFDEVITGFRLAPGGAQQYFGIKADIVVFGKILGGGFPVGALCGKREIMERLNFRVYERPYYAFQGGTFTANPITMTAGLMALKILQDGSLINKLNKTGDKIKKEFQSIFETTPVNAQVLGVASLFGVQFTKEKIKNANAISAADRRKLMDYHLKLIAHGIFFSPTHIGALSTAHSEDDLEKLFSETEKYLRQSSEVNEDVF